VAETPRNVADIVRYYNISYALFDAGLENEIGKHINHQFWDTRVKKVFQTDRYSLYDVKSFADEFYYNLEKREQAQVKRAKKEKRSGAELQYGRLY